MKINTVHEMAEKMLFDFPSARNSDADLYLLICRDINPDIENLPFAVVLKNYKQLGIPKLESVGRARRKIQHDNPDLRATEEVTDGRYEKFKEFKDYALQ